jgi:catechol 2,3-dioxygenase-like lactoylglutathione lyase family enzyme
MDPPPSIHHLAVIVRDLDRAEAFYRGVLGLPVVRRWTDEAGAPRSVWLELGGGAFLAVERAAPGGEGPSPPPGGDRAPQPGWHCVALAIAPGSRDAWRRRLEAAGASVERESPWTMYARDPEGNLVAFSHYPHAAGA